MPVRNGAIGVYSQISRIFTKFIIQSNMHFKEVKGILSSKNGMNISRGCIHGCIYCDARSKCYNLELF
jgi:DNA repair photolyase